MPENKKSENSVEACKACPSEVVGFINHMKNKENLSIRKACQKLSEELDGEMPSEALRTIYKRKISVGSNEPKKHRPPWKNLHRYLRMSKKKIQDSKKLIGKDDVAVVRSAWQELDEQLEKQLRKN